MKTNTTRILTFATAARSAAVRCGRPTDEAARRLRSLLEGLRYRRFFSPTPRLTPDHAAEALRSRRSRPGSRSAPSAAPWLAARTGARGRALHAASRWARRGRDRGLRSWTRPRDRVSEPSCCSISPAAAREHGISRFVRCAWSTTIESMKALVLKLDPASRTPGHEDGSVSTSLAVPDLCCSTAALADKGAERGGRESGRAGPPTGSGSSCRTARGPNRAEPDRRGRGAPGRPEGATPARRTHPAGRACPLLNRTTGARRHAPQNASAHPPSRKQDRHECPGREQPVPFQTHTASSAGSSTRCSIWSGDRGGVRAPSVADLLVRDPSRLGELRALRTGCSSAWASPSTCTGWRRDRRRSSPSTRSRA